MVDHEITCVQKTDRNEAHERVRIIGGINPADGKRWKLSQGEAILAIESGRARFHVTASGNAVPIVVGTSAWGIKYLRAANDRDQPHTLLNLPECPYF